MHAQAQHIVQNATRHISTHGHRAKRDTQAYAVFADTMTDHMARLHSLFAWEGLTAREYSLYRQSICQSLHRQGFHDLA